MLDAALLRNDLDAVIAGLARRGLRLRPGDLPAPGRRAAPGDPGGRGAQGRAQPGVGRSGPAASGPRRTPTDLIAAQREVGERLKALEAAEKEAEAAFRGFLATIPNLPHESVPVGQDEHANVRDQALGHPGRHRQAPGPRGAGHPPGHPGPGPRGQAQRRPVRRAQGPGRQAGAGPGRRFMADLHGGRRLDRGAAALPGAARVHVRHRPAAQVRAGPVQDLPGRGRPLPHPHRRGAGDQPLPGGDPGRGASCPCATSPSPPASAARPAATARTPRASSASTSSTRWSWWPSPPPEQAQEELEHLTRGAERVLEALELPYRRVLLCTGDMGFTSRRPTTWKCGCPARTPTGRSVPAPGSATSRPGAPTSATDRPEGKPQFLHTLNGSGLAVGRTWVAVLENYQQPDGSVRIPKALQPYPGRRGYRGLISRQGRQAGGRTGNGQQQKNVIQ